MHGGPGDWTQDICYLIKVLSPCTLHAHTGSGHIRNADGIFNAELWDFIYSATGIEHMCAEEFHDDKKKDTNGGCTMHYTILIYAICRWSGTFPVCSELLFYLLSSSSSRHWKHPSAPSSSTCVRIILNFRRSPHVHVLVALHWHCTNDKVSGTIDREISYASNADIPYARKGFV